MTEGEKGVLSLFVIGVMIVVGKVLAGGEPITPPAVRHTVTSLSRLCSRWP